MDAFKVVDGCLGMLIDTTPRSEPAVYAFDLDGTLIKPKSGRKFPKDLDDWMSLDGADTYVKRLNLLGQNHPLVIFTNQASCKDDASLQKFYEKKIVHVLEHIHVPVSVMIAGGYSHYRKPKPRMWDVYCAEMGFDRKDTPVMYVGDAAGRPGDFSDSDYAFAININAKFDVPEHFFFGEAPKSAPQLTMDPTKWLNIPKSKSPKYTSKAMRQTVLMHGPPGSGKSTWVRQHIPIEWAVISQDVLKTKARCLKAVRAALEDGKSVVVDNTFPDKKSREEYINIAKEYGASIDCVAMNMSRELASHLNAMRSDHPSHAKSRVPPIAEHMFSSKQVLPTTSEGFANVYSVNFEFDEKVTPLDLFVARHH